MKSVRCLFDGVGVIAFSFGCKINVNRVVDYQNLAMKPQQRNQIPMHCNAHCACRTIFAIIYCYDVLYLVSFMILAMVTKTNSFCFAR